MLATTSRMEPSPQIIVSFPPPDAPPDPASSYRQASFALNPDLQTNKLVSDATIVDCEFSSNNSNQNVNVKCSVGFYKAVAMPAFATLSPGFTQQSGTSVITCSNIQPSLDSNGIEFNRIFWFSVRETDGLSAAITVHLHHSTRLVQVQGGALLSDGSVAATWFVKNLLLGLFLKLGNERGHDISAFNRAVLENNFTISPTNPISDPTCNFCSKPLKKPAKPIKCFVCKDVFHTTCHRQHTCHGSPDRPRIVTRMKRKASHLDSSIFEILDDSPSPPSSSSPPSPPPHSALVPSSLSVTSTASPPSTTTTTFSASNPILSLIQPRLPTFTNLTSLPSLPLSHSSSIPDSVNSHRSQPPNPVNIPSVFLQPPPGRTNPPPPKRPKKAPAVTQEAAAVEYLKIQLNLATTKITSQDANIKRKEESISILSERLRLLELGLNSQFLHQYFPNVQTSHPSAPGATPPSTTPPPPPPSPLTPPAPPTSGPTDPTPSVSMPASNVSMRSSPPSSCHDCPNIARHLEIVLTELDLLKTQTNSLQQDISCVKDILTQQPSNPAPSPRVPPPERASPPQQTKTTGSTQPPASARQKTRHTQTQFNPPPPKPTANTIPLSRPIRPLFPPPCPWLSGTFPTGPVRHLQPARSRSRSTQPKRRATPTPSPSGSPPQSPPPVPPSQPTADPSSSPAHVDPPPSRAGSPATFQEEDSGSPLISEILDDDDDEEPPQQPPSSRTPAHSNSLNF